MDELDIGYTPVETEYDEENNITIFKDIILHEISIESVA